MASQNGSLGTPAGTGSGSSSGPHREFSTSELSQMLSNALVQDPVRQQPQTLKTLYAAFEQQPLTVPMLFGSITSIITDGRPFEVTFWAAEVIELMLSRAQISPEMRQPLLAPSLGATARLMADNNTELQKKGLGIFASAYPGLFRTVANGADQALWSKVVSLKTNALHLWRSGHAGARFAALKVIQRIIQTQTKGNADPRLSRNAEPNLLHIRQGHPFLRPQLLEDEANKLLEECITLMFTSPSADLVCAIVNVFTQLAKIRPALSNLILTSLTNWAPNALASATPLQVRSAEKTVRIALNHLLRTGHATAFVSQINVYFQAQSQRMEAAALAARRLKEQEASRKRQLIADELNSSSKRRRIESATAVDPVAVFSSASTDVRVASFDARTLPVGTVVDLLINNLSAVDDARIQHAIAEARAKLPPELAGSAGPAAAQADAPVRTIDPLKADLGDEELQLKAEVPAARLDEASSTSAAAATEQSEPATAVSTFTAANLDDLSSDLLESTRLTSAKARTAMVLGAVKRICDAGAEGNAPAIWVPLVVRLITRGLATFAAEQKEDDAAAEEAEPILKVEEDEQDEEFERREALRHYLFDFVTSNPTNRLEFAKMWLSEEWYAAGMERTDKPKEGDDATRSSTSTDRAYERWLAKVLDALLANVTNKDKHLIGFFSELPLLPDEDIRRLEPLCLRQNQLQIGFPALRDIIQSRPPSRRPALDVLLGLATHSEKLVRNAAINTLKRWVPDLPDVADIVVSFADSLIQRLAEPAEAPKAAEEPNGDGETAVAEDSVGAEEGEEGEDKPSTMRQPPFALVKDGRVVDRLPMPTNVSGIIQHVELLFGLSAKHPILIRTLFQWYGKLTPFVQDSLQQLVTPLIRALGIDNFVPTHVVNDCPEGGELLLHRVLLILQDKSNRLPSQLIPLVKELAEKRKLPDIFYPMVIGDCDKAHMVEYLPYVVSTLDGTPTQRTTVRSVFLSLITPANASSTVPRSRSQLLTPVELMSILHNLAEQIGVKKAIEAIGICFSMPDAFRPEVLAGFMQTMLDQDVLPTLFMRTVIQAATTYKTLQGFISTTLLSRLVAKQIWTLGPLWEGFIRCAKLTAPSSFGALLQLPIARIEEVVTKQPTLKDDLKSHVLKKPGLAQKHPDLLEMLGGYGEEDIYGGAPQQQSYPIAS